jgi:putative hydrolase of the HAD superfamily
MIVDALLFDLYGTLTVRVANSASDAGTAGVVIGFVNGLGIDTTDLDRDTLEEEIWHFDLPTPAGDGTPFEARLGGFFKERLGQELSAGNLRELADAVCAEWESGHQVDPDAHDLLAQFGTSRPLGLVSNFDHPPHVRRRLSVTGLERHFSTIVVSGEVGTQKPEPEILRIACRHLNVTPERCAYVGDSIVDFQAADSAGMPFFLIRRPPAGGVVQMPSVDPFTQTDAELESMAAAGRIHKIGSLAELLPEFGASSATASV